MARFTVDTTGTTTDRGKDSHRAAPEPPMTEGQFFKVSLHDHSGCTGILEPAIPWLTKDGVKAAVLVFAALACAILLILSGWNWTSFVFLLILIVGAIMGYAEAKDLSYCPKCGGHFKVLRINRPNPEVPPNPAAPADQKASLPGR